MKEYCLAGNGMKKSLLVRELAILKFEWTHIQSTQMMDERLKTEWENEVARLFRRKASSTDNLVRPSVCTGFPIKDARLLKY